MKTNDIAIGYGNSDSAKIGFRYEPYGYYKPRGKKLDSKYKYNLPKMNIKGGSHSAFESFIPNNVLIEGYKKRLGCKHLIYDIYNHSLLHKTIYTTNNINIKNMYCYCNSKNDITFARISIKKNQQEWDAQFTCLQSAYFDAEISKYDINEADTLDVGDEYALNDIPNKYKIAYSYLLLINKASQNNF